MSDKKKLTIEELEAAGGGWTFDDLSPEDQEKCAHISQELFDAGGTNLEPYWTQQWNEFCAYLNKKYGKG